MKDFLAFGRAPRALGLGLAFVVGSILAPACGSGGASSDGTGGTGGGALTTSTSATMTSTSSGVAMCNPPCPSGKFCSTTLTCIDDGTCAMDGDCTTPGTICDLMTGTCVPGGCMSKSIAANPIAPNLLITLDRSCSMTEVVSGTMTKWDIAVGAINKLTTDFNAKIRFGLIVFPDLDAAQCKQGMIPIPVAPGNEMAISTLLTASLKKADPYFPDGPCVTNIDTAVQQAATDPALMDKMRSSYVMLLTDGQQAGCSAGGGDMGTLQAIQMLAAAGVHTFVIGFGKGVDVAQMNIFANAGMEPNTGMNQFYDASDQTTLDATFQTIATKTIGCDFQLDTTPQDQSQLYAFFDNMSVARDPTHMNGWDYDPMTNKVTFYGMACQDLKGGKVKKVDVVYGCNSPPPQ